MDDATRVGVLMEELSRAGDLRSRRQRLDYARNKSVTDTVWTLTPHDQKWPELTATASKEDTLSALRMLLHQLVFQWRDYSEDLEEARRKARETPCYPPTEADDG